MTNISDISKSLRQKFTIPVATGIVAMEMSDRAISFPGEIFDYLAELSPSYEEDYEGADLILDTGGTEQSTLGHFLCDITSKLNSAIDNYTRSNKLKTGNAQEVKETAINGMISAVDDLKVNVQNYRNLFGLNENSSGVMATYLSQMQSEVIEPLEQYIQEKDYKFSELLGDVGGFDKFTAPISAVTLLTIYEDNNMIPPTPQPV